MAEFRIVVVIDPSRATRGGRQVENQLTRINRSANTTRDLLARAFAFVGLSVGISQLVSLADTFTNIQNRLRTVTNGTAELAAVTEELFEVSNRTRGSFEATAELYARVGLAARDLGISQRQLIEFTESLNQAVILSGASAIEAQAGLIQLSQGLASGALRGDELRSVLEQLPVVADVIAESLGVTRGELRELGSEGAITADIVLRAFQEARQELEDRFGQTVPTISQSFQVLRNNLIQLVGAFNESSGAATALSQSILFLADNLETVIRLIVAVSIALGVQFAVAGVGRAIVAVNALTAALLANPLTAVAAAITIVIALLVSFADQITFSSDGLVSLQDVAIAVFQIIGEAVSGFISFFADNFGFIGEFLTQVFGDVEVSIEGVLRVTAQVVDGIIGFFVGAVQAIVVAFQNLPFVLEAIFVETFNTISRAYNVFLNSIIAGINAVGEVVGLTLISPVAAFEIEASRRGQRIGQQLDEAFAEGFQSSNLAESALDSVLSRAETVAQERAAREIAAQGEIDAARAGLDVTGTRTARPGLGDDDDRITFQDILDDLRTESRLLQLSNAERQIQEGLLDAERQLKRDLTAQEAELLENVLRQNQALEAQSDALNAIRGPLENYQQGLAALEGLLARGAITTEEFTRAQRDLRITFLDTQTDLESGAERGILRVAQQFEDVASVAEDAITNAFSGAEDAIVNFVATGELEFGSLVDSILSDLARLAVRQAITAPLGQALGLNAAGGAGIFGSLFGGEGLGGVGSAIGGLFGFQQGGQFQVGGVGGVDNNVLSVNGSPVARVSRGETVSVSPEGGGARPVTINFAISTPTGNVPRETQEQIASRAAVALRRADQRNN